MISMSYVSRCNLSPVEVFPIHTIVLCMGTGYWVDASKYGNDNVTSSWIHVGYSMHGMLRKVVIEGVACQLPSS